MRSCERCELENGIAGRLSQELPSLTAGRRPELLLWVGHGFEPKSCERENQTNHGHKAFLCGPPVMIEASIRALMQGQLFERDIYTEKFLSNADGAEALAKSPLFRSI